MGCFAINAAWSNQAVALTWQDPRESVECLPAPEPKKVSKTSGLGPWYFIAHTAEVAESGSTAVEPDFGPWSSGNSHFQPSAPAAAPPSNSSFGPWGGIASAGSSSSSLGPWGSIVADSDTPTFVPWGMPHAQVLGPRRRVMQKHRRAR